jgi:hypothetical protein
VEGKNVLEPLIGNPTSENNWTDVDIVRAAVLDPLS